MMMFAIPLAIALASPADDGPPTVPPTREAMKRALEDSKRATPRLPLPPLTEEEQAKAGQGDWSVVNNGRMRKHYLPPELTGSGLGGRNDPGMSLGYPFQTMIFWIVSRGNNCTYCMGHQESKLAAAGVGEDVVAALDGDWSEFTPAERAAFAFARKLTFEPNAIGDADVDALRPHYSDAQILEIAFVAAGFNAMNRWTGALRIPQEAHREYLTPTAEPARGRLSAVAPLGPSASEAAPACARPSSRPAPESRGEVEAKLAACASRAPRLPLVEEPEARALLPADWPEGPLPGWVRLLARFPESGRQRILVHRAADTAGALDPVLRAQVAWVAARQDRAWYALALAKRRLEALGLDDDAIFALDGDLAAFPPDRRAALALAKKLTTDPALVEDADVEAVRAHFSDKETAELIWHVTEAAFFDRVTEAAGLATEPRDAAAPGR
jgi:alkylhydroperoxidase family enzyme